MPVPDGSRPAAIQISAELRLPYREGLVKNRYVGRTFIMPDQKCAFAAPCFKSWSADLIAILSKFCDHPAVLFRIQGSIILHRTREISVRRKLNAMPAVFAGKNVLLVDDSIVRGTTMSQIVEMVRP